MAAQKLSGKGFKKVINLSGGIKAWHGYEAHGRPDQGMQLFSTLTSTEQVLTTAYSLEEGLKDFYLTMAQRVRKKGIIDIFEQLARIEDVHKNHLYDEYVRLTGVNDRVAFERRIRVENMEGGLTTEEYLDHFQPNMEKEEEVISLAMAIEAQALDLYTRAAGAAEESESRKMLMRIAAEEKVHLTKLGDFLDKTLEMKNE